MTREELIERIKEAIQNKCTTVIDQTEHSTTTVGLQGALAERAATAALSAIEAAGVRLVYSGEAPAQLIDNDERTTVTIFTPYAPPGG